MLLIVGSAAVSWPKAGPVAGSLTAPLSGLHAYYWPPTHTCFHYERSQPGTTPTRAADRIGRRGFKMTGRRPPARLSIVRKQHFKWVGIKPVTIRRYYIAVKRFFEWRGSA